MGIDNDGRPAWDLRQAVRPEKLHVRSVRPGVLLGTEIVSGETWYTTNSEVMFALRPDGLWGWEHHSSAGPRMGVIYPATVNAAFGERFITMTDMAGNQIDSVRTDIIVASTNSMVTTPAGTYSCIQYKTRYRYKDGRTFAGIDGFDGNEVNYMAPGVGFVKSETFRKSPTGAIYLRDRLELTSVTLK